MPRCLLAPLWQLDLSQNYFGPAGAKPLADALCANSGLTSVNLLANKLDPESATMLLKIKAEKPNLRTLCGLSLEETELDYKRQGLGPADAMLLAPEIAVMSVLTKIDVRYNDIDDKGKAALRKAVEGRSDIELQL